MDDEIDRSLLRQIAAVNPEVARVFRNGGKLFFFKCVICLHSFYCVMS